MTHPTGQFAFYFARILGHEPTLSQFSCAQSSLLDALDGKSVALVGNARALANAEHGAAIDQSQITIRINRAPLPSAGSHGSRTDWLALATSLPKQHQSRLNPGRLLWMSHKRKRLSYATATSRGFYLHPLEDWRTQGHILGAPPSTGAMMIDLLARSTLKSADLYGFDFFASKSLSGHRDAAQVPHDFEAEANWVRALIARDKRFTLHPL